MPLHISYRSTGLTGRGNYEAAGAVGLDGVEASHLIGKRLFFLSADDRFIRTGNLVRLLDGKLRVRLEQSTGKSIHMQVAAAWLLPPPTRSLTENPSALAIEAGDFLVSRMEIGSVNLIENDAFLRIDEVEVANRAYPLSIHEATKIQVADRSQLLRILWTSVESYPAPLRDAILAHRYEEDGLLLVDKADQVRDSLAVFDENYDVNKDPIDALLGLLPGGRPTGSVGLDTDWNNEIEDRASTAGRKFVPTLGLQGTAFVGP